MHLKTRHRSTALNCGPNLRTPPCMVLVWSLASAAAVVVTRPHCSCLRCCCGCCCCCLVAKCAFSGLNKATPKLCINTSLPRLRPPQKRCNIGQTQSSVFKENLQKKKHEDPGEYSYRVIQTNKQTYRHREVKKLGCSCCYFFNLTNLIRAERNPSIQLL